MEYTMRKTLFALASIAAVAVAAPVMTAAPAEAGSYKRHGYYGGGWHGGYRPVYVVRRYHSYPAYSYGGYRRGYAYGHRGYGYGHRGYGFGGYGGPGISLGFSFR
jgi:hypothetical protein